MTKKVNISDEYHYKLKVHCAMAQAEMGIFVQEAIDEKIGREPLE